MSATDGRDVDDASLPQLLSTLGRELGEHLGTQVELAKAELRDEAKRAGVVGGMFGVAGVAALISVLLLCFAAAWGLAEVMAEGLAFLIVAAVVGAAAAVLALVAKGRAARLQAPLVDTKTELEEDLTWARQQR